MKIIDSGHKYLLDGIDGGDRQTLTFVKREGDKYPFNVGAHGGTNVQEVLRCLIERTEYLNRQIPCAETEAAIGLLKSTLLLFEIRAAKNHGRHLDVSMLSLLSSLPTCEVCGHIGCGGHPEKRS